MIGPASETIQFGERVLSLLEGECTDEMIAICRLCQEQVKWPKDTSTYYCGYVDENSFLVRLICRRDLKTWTSQEVSDLYRSGKLKDEIETLMAIDILLHGKDR